MTTIKFLAFGFAVGVTLCAMVSGTLQIAAAPTDTGWRGALALLISTLAAGMAILIVSAAFFYRRVEARRTASACHTPPGASSGAAETTPSRARESTPLSSASPTGK